MNEFTQIIADNQVAIIFGLAELLTLAILYYGVESTIGKELKETKDALINLVNEFGFTGKKQKVLSFKEMYVGMFALVKIDNRLFYVQYPKNQFSSVVDRKVVAVEGTRGRVAYLHSLCGGYDAAYVFTNTDNKNSTMWIWRWRN